jgi:hypothetical protein
VVCPSRSRRWIASFHDRRLGHVRPSLHVAGHSHALAGCLFDRDKRLVRVVVDAGQVVEVALAEAYDRGEEPPVTGLRAQMLKPFSERRTILGLDRPD